MLDNIGSRVARIVSGSVHALLDAMEDATAESTMIQAVREVDQVIDEVRAELGRAEASKHLATSQLNKLNTESEHLAEQIEVALRQDREDLARLGLEKQINIEDQVPVLQKSLAEQIERSRELEGYVTALLAKRREMEQALQEFIAASASRSATAATDSSRLTNTRRVEDAGSSFDRVLARQTGVVPGTADAVKLKELQDLQRTHRVEERLAKLKASRKTTSPI